MSRVVAVGDGALQVVREDVRTSSRTLLEHLRALPAARDVIVTEAHALVVLREGSHDDLEAALASAEADATAREPQAKEARDVRIPVVYDGEDLAEVARLTGLRASDVVEAHARADYEVSMVGFLPGFAYLRGLDPRLVLPRRDVPRPRVPRGAVAIGAAYTGVYPSASPGGWHLLGQSTRFVPFGASGAALALGDRVRFVPTDEIRDESREEDPPLSVQEGEHDAAPCLLVTRVQGFALVVDAGRFGHMHEGVPEGGPLVVDSLARANDAADNAPGAAGLEIYGVIEVVARGGRFVIGIDDGETHVLEDGASMKLSSSRDKRARYLAVHGGFDVPLVLGSRTTLLGARLGGFRGRGLRRGDRLPAGRASTPPAGRAVVRPPRDTHIHLLPGPDADEDSLRELERMRFVVGHASDRTGTRLEPEFPLVSRRGAHSPSRPSAPMVLGAIERTPSGYVVLGPDHPTTGGYPLVAVVADASRDAFFDRPIGSLLTFRR